MRFTEVLTKLDIPYRAEGHEHCRPGWVQMDCPDCSPGWHHWRLGYNLRAGYMSCWACGYKRVLEVLHKDSGRSYRELRELLGWVEYEGKDAEEVRGVLKYPADVGQLLAPHRKYLKSRGLDPAVVQNGWGVRGIGISAELPWRLFIPIHKDGKVVSWTTRAIGDQVERRYRAAKADQEREDAKRLLYGADHARHGIIVCEGPVDCWRVGPGAVATLGTAYTEAQLYLMAAYPLRIICFDAEEAAQVKARRLLNDLSDFPGHTMNVVLESAKDPGDAAEEEIQSLRELIK